MGRHGTKSICVLVRMDDAPCCHEDDFHVEPEGPVLYVPDIMLYPFLHEPRILGLAPVSRDLRPAGNAGL